MSHEVSTTSQSWHSRLTAVNACVDARLWCADFSGDEDGWRDAFDSCEDSRWFLWLSFRVLHRRRAMSLLLEVAATAMHLMSDAMVLEVMGPLAQWGAGNVGIDIHAVRRRALDLRYVDSTKVVDAAAAYVTTTLASYAADAVSYAGVDGAADDVVYAADAVAYSVAAGNGGDKAAARSAHCDTIRAHITAAELYAALMVA